MRRNISSWIIFQTVQQDNSCFSQTCKYSGSDLNIYCQLIKVISFVWLCLVMSCQACGILPLKWLSGTFLLDERTVISLRLALYCTNTNHQLAGAPKRHPQPPTPHQLPPPCTSQIWLEEGQSSGLCKACGGWVASPTTTWSQAKAL